VILTTTADSAECRSNVRYTLVCCAFRWRQLLSGTTQRGRHIS